MSNQESAQTETIIGVTQKNNTDQLGPKTLILDLDETLVHSWEKPSFIEPFHIYTDPSVYRKFHPIGNSQLCYSILLEQEDMYSQIWGMYRPHLHEFLSFAGNYFQNILVWSAGINKYVDQLTQQIFLRSGLSQPKVVWSRTNCHKYKEYYHKPISELIEYLSKRHYQPFTIDPKSTLIVDDKTYTFMENQRNGILIPPYVPGNEGKITSVSQLLDRSDNCLLKLKTWLELDIVRNCTDVRNLDKTMIFK